MSHKKCRPWSPKQSYLLPPSPLEWLPEGHLAYFILEVVEDLDLRDIKGPLNAKDHRGERPYSPRMMVSLLLYAYSVGVLSSRKIERATYEDVAFRVLSGGSHPHFTTINEFRRVHIKAFRKLFVQVLVLCQRAGLVQLGRVAIDGSKVKANASKHKAMSYKRLMEQERRLAAEVAALMVEVELTDQSEDERYGKGQRPEDLPEELQRRESRLARIRQARQELEQEAALARAEELEEQAEGQRRKAEQCSDPVEAKRAAMRAKQRDKQARALRDDYDDDDAPPTGGGEPEELPHHRVAHNTDGTPKDKAQRNFTAPDSRIMVKDGAFIQAYNGHIVVDEQAQVILAEGLSNQPPDTQHLIPMMHRVKSNCGKWPETLLADTGYLDQYNVEFCQDSEVSAYIAVGREGKGQQADEEQPQTEAAKVRQAMREKLKTDRGKTAYARRKVIVEPVFGQMKTRQGFRRFSLRSLAKAADEWTLVCLCHNLYKLFLYGSPTPQLAPAA